MNKDLITIFEYMEREKGIKREVVIQAIEESLLTAARRTYHGEANISVKIDGRTGDIEVYCEKQIVERVVHPNRQISLEEARELDPDCEVGQFIDIEVTPENFGRIAAQSARQVIAQKLRSAERDVIYEEYRHRVNEIVSGAVKRFARGSTLVIDLGKVEAIMPARHYPREERYQPGDRVQALLYAVQDLEDGGAVVVLSRSAPEFVRQLFIQEVPEINDGTVTIEKIVREPGYRTKIIVRSNDPRVDPVGTCVGVRGSRVKAVVRELNNEKVDIIPFAEDPIELLENALDPIEIRKVGINEEAGIISIVVDDDAYAKVIGRGGKNARLNGQMLGYEFEAQKISDYMQLMAVTRRELADSGHPCLDEPLKLRDMSSLISESLAEAGYTTAKKILEAGPADLANVPGISSLEMADRILEEVQGHCQAIIAQDTAFNRRKEEEKSSSEQGEEGTTEGQDNNHSEEDEVYHH